MYQKIRIAIDGPAGAGKSTMAKILAEKLNIDYIDTGAMYRAIALKVCRTGTDYTDPAALEQMLAAAKVDYIGGKVYLDGEDVSGQIRTPEISAMASKTSAIPAVRDKLSETQSAMARERSLLMDGRDIGTIIIPDAEFKFYLNAGSRVRALRRAREMQAKGLECDVDQVEQEIIARDEMDMNRDYHPLKKAEDAIEIDTSYLSVEEVVEKMMEYINE